MARMQSVKVYDEDEAQWTTGIGASSGGWSGSLGHGGFSGSVGGNWNSARPTNIGVGYSGNLGGGQFTAGATKTIGGGFGASVGWTTRFDEELDEAQWAMDRMPRCVCVRAPCPC